MMAFAPERLLGRLETVPDPRRRQGRRYPLASLLGLLVLGALHGESSLRGIWIWAHQPWDSLWQPLGFRSPHFPARTTSWKVLGTIEADALDRSIGAWRTDRLGQPVGGVSADGKVLRGSRRAEVPAVWFVAVARHDVGTVLSQRQVAAGRHAVPALLSLLRAVPLQDQIITLDAGLVCAATTQGVRDHQGDDLGVVKGNQAEIKAARADWVRDSVFVPAPPSTERDDRGAVTRTH